VRALSNCDEVEMFLNGKSLGRQAVKRVSEVQWKVAYQPGVLSAKGWRGGQLVAEAKVETTGAPAAVRLVADRPTLDADGQDIAVVAVSVVDEQGRIVPTAANPIAFKLGGPGRIIGVGNGDPSSHEPDQFVAAPTLRTRALDDWRWTKVADSYAPELPEVSANVDDSRWTKADVRSERGPLAPNDRAVFRTHFRVSAQDLAASGVELWFGKIDGGIAVFLNGRKIAPTGDPRAPSIYDVKALLRPGENSVAVSMANWGDAAGINKGVMLRLVDQPRSPEWRRSLFAGLAQTIIQTTSQSGTVKLTAESSGLSGATLSLVTRTGSRHALLP
jgi:beta-galactosidase